MKKISLQHFELNELTSMELNQIYGGDNVTQKIFNWFGRLCATMDNINEEIGKNYTKYGGPCMA